MSDFENPAIAALAKRIAPELTWGQVHIRLVGDGGYVLRHVDDAEASAGRLAKCNPPTFVRCRNECAWPISPAQSRPTSAAAGAVS